MVLGTAICRLSPVLHDSRDSVPSKDKDLALLGMMWATDLATETELAQQLAASRLRRTQASDRQEDR